MCKLQKLLWKGQDDCNAIHRALPQMEPISPFISVMQHQTCFNADVEHFTGDHIYCSTLLIFQLGYLTEVTSHGGDYDIDKQQQKKKNIQKFLNQLLPDYFTLSSIRGVKIKTSSPGLLKAEATKHQKLKIFLPYISSYFRIKHIFPPEQVITFAATHLVSLRPSTTIRTKGILSWSQIRSRPIQTSAAS